jgi:hypothetical protein
MENITHKPIMVQDEDRRTEAVVNAAAREPDAAKSDNEPVHNAGELDLEPDEPDFTLYDVAERLSFTACGRVPLLPDHAALLYAIVNALHSISNTTIGRRLAERYGYSTIRMARQSGKQVRVIIQTADRELSELGRVFAEAERPKLYLSMLTEDDRSRYTELIAETSRFDTSWQAVSPAVPELVAVHKWASELLPTIKHDGPVQSFKTRIHLMERQAKRLATTTPNTSAA